VCVSCCPGRPRVACSAAVWRLEQVQCCKDFVVVVVMVVMVVVVVVGQVL